ncbi:potassium-transporting ATPase subunit KdpC [Belnapia sp. T18]|uniref:Potassium-transporting ATPase KdpC subunit n=1 Tax=Belnapia arida TaxID=2804533 RepID=A0ABS1UC53_9PROT|nr:potassium-transporting ATPase subunit KdpC [Belnapia arida]MBL6082264.1 potassium-transporting ATPase subunit KdpC [Belnapia arida]
MNTLLRPAITMVVALTAVTGLTMPLAMTGVAQLVFPKQADGSLIERDGKIVGSSLIGQAFTSERYFHSRPSATTEADPDNEGKTRAAPYNAAASAASQQGPTSESLLASVRERVEANGPAPMPADAATASGSGLDPHISPANAVRQIARVAAARGLPAERVQAAVAANTEGRELGLLGEPRVNVLRLNLALDALR